MPLASTVVATALLQRAYQANKLPHVAYIDESYLPPSTVSPGGTTFYIATAYIAPCTELEPIRGDLRAIVGGNFWHTTEAHRGEALRPVISELSQYIGDGGEEERLVIALKRPIEATDRDGEHARRDCLIDLFAALNKGDVGPAIGLAVFEQRRFTSQRRRRRRRRRSDHRGWSRCGKFRSQHANCPCLALGRTTPMGS